MNRPVRTMAGLLAAATAAAGGLALAAPSAVAAPHANKLPTVVIKASAKGFTVTGSRTVPAGPVKFDLVAAKGKYFGAGFGVQRYEKGYSFAKSLRDEKFVRAHDDQAGNTDSKGAKRLRRFEAKTTAYGGSSASPGTSTVVTMVLTKGTYTVFDEATAVPSHPSILHVTGSTSHRSAPASRGTIIAKPGDRFGGSKTLPAHGTIAFRNHGDQDHFVALVQVQNGTTHKQVADYFAQQTQAPPAFALGEAVGSDLVSPHHSMTFTEKAPKGEYVEVCFMQDDKTGMQHAYMGMFRIVHLR